ncbi:MAG: tetratricopeptide repeat protein, partial [Phycisphaerales bacterium]
MLFAYAEAREAVPADDGGHILGAIRLRQMIAEIDPEDLEATRSLMRLYTVAGFAAEADRQADLVLRIANEDSEALSVKLQIAAMRGRTAEAERLSERLLASDGADIQSLRARISLLASDKIAIDEAMRQIRDWNLPPSLEAARQAVLADLLMRQGNVEAAVATAEAATRLPVTDLEAAASIADSLDRGGAGAAATAYLEQAMTTAAEKEPFADYLIRRHWRAGRLEMARRELERGESVLGRTREPLLRWRLRLAASGMPDTSSDQAASALVESSALLPPLERRAAKTWTEAIRLAASDPDSPAADAAIDAAIEAAPRDGLLRLLRGEKLLSKSQFD